MIIKASTNAIYVAGHKSMVNTERVIRNCTIMLEQCFITVQWALLDGFWEILTYIHGWGWIEERFAKAEEHLLVGTDHSAELLGQVAASWAKVDNNAPPGLFIARVVFQ